MKVVAVGGTGLIGFKVVQQLHAHGHHATPAVPQTGRNTLANEGVADARTGTQVVVDVSTSPSFAAGRRARCHDVPRVGSAPGAQRLTCPVMSA